MPKKAAKKQSPPSSKRRPGCLVAIAVAIAVLVIAGFVEYEELTQPMSPGSRARVLVDIPHGASTRSVGRLLTKRGIIRNRYAFSLAAKLDTEHKSLKPGTYELSPGMTPAEVLSTIENGRVSMTAVTFPEGWTLEQMGDLLARRGMVDRETFLQEAEHNGRSFTAPHGFVPPDDNLEGYLFPDTYRFGQKCGARFVVAEMLGNFERRVVTPHADVSDWRKVMIVGSLVEREAKWQDDRAPIASVIYNRLRIGMRLQIDATVQYALPHHKARLMYSDLKVSSPYNTYRHSGLPPTPICCPGLPSIEAAIAPAKTDYLFYVSGPHDKHIFTKSMAEHDAVRARLRATGEGR